MILEQERRTYSVASPSAREAIGAVSTGFEEFGKEVRSEDPLGWPRYRDQLARASERSGENEGVVTGGAYVGETPVIIVAFDFNFLGGSVGGTAPGTTIRAFVRGGEPR